jgi:hypothetical protein
MTDLFYWGGPVTDKQPKAVAWERPTAILSDGRTGSDAASAAYREFSAKDGFAWQQMARKAKIEPEQLGSLGIGGFSAFHGFANAFLRNDQDRRRVKYVHLADACFMGRGATEPFGGYLKYAVEAASGLDKLMVVTTNGPWGEPIYYCWDYGPPKGKVCYDLTSGAQCFALVWNGVLDALGPEAESQVVQPIAPPGVKPPDRAMQIGNLLWFHYEPAGGDSHGMHVHELATPYLQFFGAPWMARSQYPGMPVPKGMSRGWKLAAVGIGAAALTGLGLYLHRRLSK